MREDCYYFIVSTCARGDTCAYRHSEEAKHTENVCVRWKNGQQCTDDCPNRHSNYQEKEKKSGTSCYWESHGGCKKDNCTYVHWNKKPSLLDVSKINLDDSMIENSYGSIYIKTIEELEKDLQELNQMF